MRLLEKQTSSLKSENVSYVEASRIQTEFYGFILTCFFRDSMEDHGPQNNGQLYSTKWEISAFHLTCM